MSSINYGFSLNGSIWESSPIELRSDDFCLFVDLKLAGTVSIFISNDIDGEYTEAASCRQYVADKYSMNIVDGVVGQYVKIRSTSEIESIKIKWDGNYWKN